jgi:hypothetical protein
MPISRHYLPEHNFVLTRLFGAVDDDQLRRHVLDLSLEAVEMPAICELADCREVTNVDRVTVKGVVQAAEQEAGHPHATGGRLVIVVASQLIYGMARAYAIIASEQRADTHVCYDSDEAVRWLGLDEVRPQIDRLLDEARDSTGTDAHSPEVD